MRVEQVQAFVVLAEELNFRRAAARLYVSQPTLTAQLHALERDVGVVLFDRGPGGTRLTEAGEELLPVARDVLRSVADLLDVAAPWRRDARQPARRQVRIGIGPGGLGPATWPALQALVARRPELEPTLVTLTFRTALPALDRGDVEAVLLHGPVDEAGPRRVTTVGHVPVAAIVSSSHRLARQDVLCVDEVLPQVRAMPPAQMSAAFADFWLQRNHPLSPATGLLRPRPEETQELVREVARSGAVGLWPSDVEVAAGSGAALHPLADLLLAPLQVVARAGWRHADDLLAAAAAAVWAAGRVAAVSWPSLPGDRHS